MKAIFEKTVIAQSDNTVVVEGNHYFPESDVAMKHLVLSDLHTTCHWKGLASYYHVVVDDKMSSNAAWFYPDPKQEAKHIKGYIAFWKDVNVVSD